MRADENGLPDFSRISFDRTMNPLEYRRHVVVVHHARLLSTQEWIIPITDQMPDVTRVFVCSSLRARQDPTVYVESLEPEPSPKHCPVTSSVALDARPNATRPLLRLIVSLSPALISIQSEYARTVCHRQVVPSPIVNVLIECLCMGMFFWQVMLYTSCTFSAVDLGSTDLLNSVVSHACIACL